MLPTGYEAGATPDNAVLAAHLLFTVVIVLGRLVQLLPVVRRRVPGLHRWSGRLHIAAAALAWRAARARRFDEHRCWALRLFVAVSGVWFFRVGLMAWVGVFQAPVGFDAKTFSGPFLTALAWGVYVVVPLLLLEAVLRAQRAGAPAVQQGTVAATLALVTLVTAFGVLIATLGMWGPRIVG